MNVEEAIIKHLNAHGFKAFADVPKPRPEKFVTVERTGGAFGSHRIDRPTVAVQSWAQSRYEASCLAYDVDACLRAIAFDDTSGVTQCTRNSLYNWPDEHQPRYQATYDLVTM